LGFQGDEVRIAYAGSIGLRAQSIPVEVARSSPAKPAPVDGCIRRTGFQVTDIPNGSIDDSWRVERHMNNSVEVDHAGNPGGHDREKAREQRGKLASEYDGRAARGKTE